MPKKKYDSDDDADLDDEDLEDDFFSDFSEDKKPAKKKVKETKENKENKNPSNNKASEKDTKTVKETKTKSNSTSNSSNATTSYNADGTIDITKGPPIVTDSAAKKLIMQYFIQQNRPYSLLQIFENLHKRIAKPTLEKCLTSLSVPGEGLCCKEYGKAKIYYPDQSLLNSDFTPEMLENIIGENEELRQEHSELSKTEKMLKSQISSLSSEPTDDELQRLINEYKERIDMKNKKVATLTSNINLSKGSSTIDDKIKEFNRLRLAWIARKTMCMDVVEMLSEGLNKKSTEVFSMLGVETDKDVGAEVPIARQPPKKR